MLEDHVIRRRAQEARELRDNPAFTAISAEILDAAAQLFLDANSGIDVLTRAHEGVRAVQQFKAAMQSRIDAETVLMKRKGQDRASD